MGTGIAEIKWPSRHRSGMEWPTIIMIAGCYGSWAAIGAWLWPLSTALSVFVMALAIAMHSSLMHECAHGHPTRAAWLNEMLVALPIGLVWPYRRFRTLHLRHHADERLTDPFDDPESYYRALWQHRQLPRAIQAVLAANNTMLGRMALNPLLSTIGFISSEVALMRAGNRSVRVAWLLHLAGLAIVSAIVVLIFSMPIWAYGASAYLAQSVLSIRTFAEHQWAERPEGRTIIVERSPLSVLFLNNNLHFVHHKNPTVAWYRLPQLFRARRAEWLRENGGYCYPGYLALLKAYALRPKEPVVHPALRREPEPGASFRPRIRARSVAGLGSAPVPAEPRHE
jgi:fatty acid desaturase